MIIKKIKNLILVLSLLIVFLPVLFVRAGVVDSIKGKMSATADKSGYNMTGATESALPFFAGEVIRVFLSLLGTIFVILVIYAGYKYFMAQGDPGETKKALDMIWKGIIGLIIIVGAYAIWGFVYTSLIGN